MHGRVEDPALVARVLAEESIEVVLHLAAESHVDRSIRGPGPFITTNVVGTQVLLDAARAAGVRRFLLASSDEVYGSTPAGIRFTEDAPLRPSSPYAASKAAADLLAHAYVHTFGMEVVVSRASNTFGPRQFPEKLLPLAIINALEGRPIPVYGDGLQERDWLHVDDHCRALLQILLEGQPGRAYNVGAGTPRPNREVLAAVLARLGASPSLLTQVADRPGHDRRYALDTTRLERELGWRPRRELTEALAETVDWYARERGWWQRVRDGSYREYYRAQYGDSLEEPRR